MLVGAHAVLCFKCNQPGHLARECLGGQVPAHLLAPVCLRCGREDCPAAHAGDYVRCGLSACLLPNDCVHAAEVPAV